MQGIESLSNMHYLEKSTIVSKLNAENSIKFYMYVPCICCMPFDWFSNTIINCGWFFLVSNSGTSSTTVLNLTGN
uniref:Uncharacterized protein n=1 Tax=Pararge aegeria TaxID=116150 RepID=S4NYD2_9NEOP